MGPESQRGGSEPQSWLIKATGQSQTRQKAVGIPSSVPSSLWTCVHLVSMDSSSHPLRVECLPGGPWRCTVEGLSVLPSPRLELTLKPGGELLPCGGCAQPHTVVSGTKNQRPGPRPATSKALAVAPCWGSPRRGVPAAGCSAAQRGLCAQVGGGGLAAGGYAVCRGDGGARRVPREERR